MKFKSGISFSSLFLKAALKTMLQLALIAGAAWSMHACSTESDKANAEDLNNERFDDRGREREAQFVVDVLDASYGILEVAQVTEDKSEDILSKGKAKSIVESQTSAIVRLKAYAESHDISIPFSGPASTRNSVKKLYDRAGSDFEEAWRTEINRSSTSLIERIEKFEKNADATLQAVLINLRETLEENQKLIADTATIHNTH